MEGWPTRHVVVRRVLVRWSIPVYQAVLISPVVPVAEASLSLSGPAGQWLAGTRPKSM